MPESKILGIIKSNCQSVLSFVHSFVRSFVLSFVRPFKSCPHLGTVVTYCDSILVWDSSAPTYLWLRFQLLQPDVVSVLRYCAAPADVQHLVLVLVRYSLRPVFQSPLLVQDNLDVLPGCRHLLHSVILMQSLSPLLLCAIIEDVLRQ